MSNRPKYRDFSSFSQDMFLHDLNQITWDSTYDVNDVDKLFSSFFSKVNRVINEHAPLKTASRKKVKQLLKPWITKGILKSVHLKNQFFCSGKTEKYKLYWNKISSLTRKSTKLYFSHYFTANLHNAKQIWQGINFLINKSKNKSKRNPSIIMFY